MSIDRLAGRALLAFAERGGFIRESLSVAMRKSPLVTKPRRICPWPWVPQLLCRLVVSFGGAMSLGGDANRRRL
jgi:hypothetical protein